MRKKTVRIILIIICALLIILLLQCCNHEDLTTFSLPVDQLVTFDVLLSAPYVTDGCWSFVNRWSLFYMGESVTVESSLNENEIVTSRLQAILSGNPLHAYFPDKKVWNYDNHIKDFLWIGEENTLLHFQFLGGPAPATTISEGDITPKIIEIYLFDETKLYLTISYQTQPEPNSKGYVFYSEDQELISELRFFAQELINEYALQ